MEMNEDLVVRQAERTASRVIEGNALVVAIDTQQLHTLNAVGSRIWELSDGRTIGAIADTIATEFDVERDEALSDSCRFLRELVSLGVIEVQA
jgi:hypothetical protein